MVLGLGSRSKKPQDPSISSQLVDFELRLREIKPWRWASPKAAVPLILRWNRGDKAVGYSKVIQPVLSDASSGDGGKLDLDERIRIAVSPPNPEILKQAKKILPDVDRPLVFSLLEANNAKGQPIAQYSIELTSFLSLTRPRDFSVPLPVPKKMAYKDVFPRLHFTISLYSEKPPSKGRSASSSSANSASSPIAADSAFSAALPLDVASQEALVAALCSDDESETAEDEELASFTDDENDDGYDNGSRKSQPSRITEAVVAQNHLQKSENPQIVNTVEMQKQSGNADGTMLKQTVSWSQQSSPARAAAIAAATSYTPRRSFLRRDVKDDLDDLYSSEEEEEISPFSVSRVAQSVNMSKRSTSGRDFTSGSVKMAGGKEDSIKSSVTAETDLHKGATVVKATDTEVLKDDTQIHSSTENVDLQSDQARGVGIEAQQQLSVDTKIKSATKPTLVVEKHVTEQLQRKDFRVPGKELKISTPAGRRGKTDVSKNPESLYEKPIKQSIEGMQHNTALGESMGSATGDPRVQQLLNEISNLKEELRDVAAIEAALYSATAEHGSSSLKLHAPARRLARIFFYSCKHGTHGTTAGCARNTIAGLVLVARTCGNDVPRLTFWWSNVVVLRETVSKYVGPLSASSKVKFPKDVNLDLQKLVLGDWTDTDTFLVALELLEGYLYTKVVESIWWQVLAPKMQRPMNNSSPEFAKDDVGTKTNDRKVHENTDHDDVRQGSISVEIWKKAFLDAYERLCPVRRLGVECGCLPVLHKMVLEACVSRLDVAMFNAIIRDDEVPTDPISDPISDTQVLPISTNSLSFGLGAQLKHAVATLSSWLSNLINKDGVSITSNDIAECEERTVIMFPLLKAMGGLLMLPKDMLLDKSLRKEVCPTLSVLFIGKILSKFQPDEFSPDPVSSELLDAINSEIAAEKDEVSALQIVSSPSITYCCPQSSTIKQWIGDAATLNNGHMNRSNSSILRKGHTSDDEIDELESPILWLLQNTTTGSLPGGLSPASGHVNGREKSNKETTGLCCRYQLLREVWRSS